MGDGPEEIAWPMGEGPEEIAWPMGDGTTAPFNAAVTDAGLPAITGMSRVMASRRVSRTDLSLLQPPWPQVPWPPHVQPADNHPGIPGRMQPAPGQQPVGDTEPPI